MAVSPSYLAIHQTELLPLFDQLPILLVVTPLLAAAISAILPGRLAPFLLSLFVAWSCFVFSLILIWQIGQSGEAITYAIGGWAPPYGIALHIDAFNAPILAILTAIGAMATLFCYDCVFAPKPKPSRRQSEYGLFYSAWLLCLGGLIGVAATGDAFNLFVFLEISSLASYILVASGADKDPRALTGAFHYLVMGTIGATFFVIGLGFLYITTGTLNLVDLADRLAQSEENRTMIIGFSFITIGLGLKSALFPLHSWLPAAYANAPTPVAILLAGAATKISIYALLRFVFAIFGANFPFVELFLLLILLPLGLLGALLGALVACFRQNCKRILAYSSISQIGYIMIGVALAFDSKIALSAALLHILNHALIKATAFAGIGTVEYHRHGAKITDLDGLAAHRPLCAAAITIAGASLIGIPGTVGFVSKFYLVLAAIEAGYWPVAGLILFSSLLALIYVWRMVEAMYLHPAACLEASVAPTPILLQITLVTLAGSCLVFGVAASLFVNLAANGAQTLLLLAR